MQLIQPFEALIRGGMHLTLRISAAGETNIQLDILPQGVDTKTGIALPPRALVGTAQELDDNLEEFVRKYAASVVRVADVVAGADAELQKIEADASAQAKQAVQDKAKSRSAAKPAGKSPASRAGATRDLSKGLAGEEGDGEDDHDDDADGGGGDTAATTLVTTGGAAAPAAAPAPAAEGLSPALF